MLTTLTSVVVPSERLQRISAREPTVNGETTDWRLTGTAQVRPATVIDVAETALTVPLASLFSFTAWVDLH